MYNFNLVKFWLHETSFFIKCEQHTWKYKSLEKNFPLLSLAVYLKIFGQNIS